MIDVQDYLPDLRGCQNSFKHHLWRLLDIPKDRQTEPYKEDNDEVLVLFPLFQTAPGDTSLEHHICRSSLWARRSWILFSDAVELGIKLAFYVGDTVLDRVIPILEASGVDCDTHVYLLNEAPFEGDPCTHLGKKLSFFNDSQFRGYKWVFQMDADMCLASPSREKGSFFQTFLEKSENVVYALHAHYGNKDINPPHKNIEKYHWWIKLTDDADAADKVIEWIHRAETLVDKSVVDRYRNDNHYVTENHGGIYAFPITYYQTEHPEKCEWIAKAGQLMQDDEAVFSLWHMRGDPLLSIVREFNLPLGTEVGNIEKASQKADPIYLSHFATFHPEWQWRADIDAL